MTNRRTNNRGMTDQRVQRHLDMFPLSEACEECGKLRYRSRKGAKAARRRIRNHSDGNQLTVYRCGDYWHIGHSPWQIRDGIESRAEYRERVS